MKHANLNLFTIIFLLFLNNSCTKIFENSSKETDIEDITETINSCIGWFETKDFELLFSTVACDSIFLSVHPTNKTIRGFEQFKKNSEVFKQPEFKYVRHEVKDLTVNFSMSGDVAWFYCILDDINEWKGQPANWENTRWTGVLEKREGRWMIVQQHFSFAHSKIMPSSK